MNPISPTVTHSHNNDHHNLKQTIRAGHEDSGKNHRKSNRKETKKKDAPELGHTDLNVGNQETVSHIIRQESQKSNRENINNGKKKEKDKGLS